MSGLNEPNGEELNEILGVNTHGKDRNGDYVICVVSGKSGFHVRPSIAFMGVVKDFSGKFSVLLRAREGQEETLVEGTTDILSLGLRGGVKFEIVLRGDFLSPKNTQDFVDRLETLEKPEVVGCESIPNALKRILG